VVVTIRFEMISVERRNSRRFRYRLRGVMAEDAMAGAFILGTRAS
jgi:hypothetical protein